jgi:hypothetical protein
MHRGSASTASAFHKALNETGYFEGRNLGIEFDGPQSPRDRFCWERARRT